MALKPRDGKKLTPTTSKRARSRATGAPSPSSAVKPPDDFRELQLASSSSSVADEDMDDVPKREDGDVDENEDEDEVDDDEESEDWVTGEEYSDSEVGVVLNGALSASSDDDVEGGGGAGDSDSDSDGDGITEAALDRLMSLIGPDEIPREELEALAQLPDDEREDGDEDEDEDSEEDGGSEDEEASEEDYLDETEIITKNGHADEDVDAMDEDGEDYEDLPPGVADEDLAASIKRKVIKNDESALERLLGLMKPASALTLDFFETQTLSHTSLLSVNDVHDDINREIELYKVALAGAQRAHALFHAASKPFFRPADYFAEMLKSDAQMEKIRGRLLDEQGKIKASEEARRQRGLKKFGKAVQVQRRLEREKEAKRVKEGVNELRKKRKGAALATGGEDEFDIALDDALEDTGRPSKRSRTDASGRGRGARGGRGGARMPRSARDAKFGRPKPAGVSGHRRKENTKESSARFAGFGGKGDGKPRAGGLGGGARGRRGGKRGGGPQRPGKSKRISRR